MALSAFEQYKDNYDDWDAFSQSVAKMSTLSDIGEIIVAENAGEICGAVTYIGPGKPKAAFFEKGWPIIRMLIVEPGHRGRGIGRRLTEECIHRAKRDRAGLIALHTSPIMEAALNMYLRMGFTQICEAPPIHGVPYDVYIKRLANDV